MRCTICRHPDVAEISKAIMAGGSNQSVAVRFGASTSSIHRHRNACLNSPRRKTGSTTATAAAAPTTEPQTLRFEHDNPQALVTMTARLVDEALDLLEHAKTQKDTRTALSALREARDGLALLMRAAGLLAGDGTVTIDARRQTIELVAGLSTDDLRRLAALTDASDNRLYRTRELADG